MVKITFFELKDEVLYLTSVSLSFLLASVIFYQSDLLYMISSYGFVLTAENALSLLALLTILISVAAVVVFLAKVRIGTAFYQIYTSFTLVVTSVNLFLFVVLWIMIFVYSAGKTLTAALWILVDKIVTLAAFLLVIYLHWILKKVIANKESVFYQLSTNDNDAEITQQSFEMQAKE